MSTRLGLQAQVVDRPLALLPSPLEDDGGHHPAQGLGLVDLLGVLDRLLGDPAARRGDVPAILQHREVEELDVLLPGPLVHGGELLVGHRLQAPAGRTRGRSPGSLWRSWSSVKMASFSYGGVHFVH